MAVLKNKTLNDFFIYWDGVIASWLEGKFAFEQQLSQDASKQELEIQKQEQILGQEWLNLSRNHMPEPYWGNPEKCSIVIANYNPGGGADRNRHAYFKCADWEHTFINKVKKSNYSDVASGFPIIDEPDLNKPIPAWWEDYGGSKWWRKKHDWLKNSIINNKELHRLLKNNNNTTEIKECGNKKPFAIEFCGWHSKSWPGGACKKLYKYKEAIIDKYFIDVLVEAVKCSDLKIGICTGKQLYDLLSKCAEKTQDQELESQKYNLHLLELKGVKILSVWGETDKRDRFPDLTK